MMNKKPRLFCFTYAGGSASFFDQIESDLSEIELVKLEYSGHGTRHREPFYHNFDELAEDLYHQIRGYLNDGTYALFGYSMGSIALIEILKRILSEPNIQPPKHVFLAAHEPHTKTELTGFESGELDEWVINRTVRFGAVPEKLLHNRSFWRVYLPIYRADYSIIGAYRFEELKLKTDIPADVFYSETDTPKKEIELWNNFFIGRCVYHCFDGNHFFIQNYHLEMAQIIREEMLQRGKYNDDV